MLGGKIIRDLHDDLSLRKMAADRLLRNVIREDGGPLVHNGSDEEQRSFDSSCRKLHRFLTQPQVSLTVWQQHQLWQSCLATWFRNSSPAKCCRFIPALTQVGFDQNHMMQTLFYSQLLNKQCTSSRFSTRQ
jgi:hypothetical protein